MQMSVATITADSFRELLFASGLLDEAAKAKVSNLGLDMQPQAFAKLLIQKGIITAYQADQLLRGRHKGFFIGAYKILKIIGSGGMGKVYLAQHTSLNRQVAIKVLPAKAAKDRLAVERFFREGQATAALNHPNIVSLYDFNEGAGIYYLVMEYVEGVNLQSFIDKGVPLDCRKVVAMILQAAKGLHHAHSLGFVHRDIKPANLMINKQGVLKILDLGLAKETAKAGGLTEQFGDKNSAAGTVDYVSPEQALGAAADHRSDIYSLGVTFYALLTGSPPFSGTTAQKLMAHQLTEPTSLHMLAPHVPEYICDIVTGMMAKKPVNRFSSMQEVISALEYSKQQSNQVRTTKPLVAAQTAPQAIPELTVSEEQPPNRSPNRKIRSKKFKKKAKQSGSKGLLFFGIGLLVVIPIAIALIYVIASRSGANKTQEAAATKTDSNSASRNMSSNAMKLVKIMHSNGMVMTIERQSGDTFRLVLKDDINSELQKFEVLQSGVAFMIKNPATGRYIGLSDNSEGASVALFSDTKDSQRLLWLIDADRAIWDMTSILDKASIHYDAAKGIIITKGDKKTEWRNVETR
jgi:serine/threonine protein kinase